MSNHGIGRLKKSQRHQGELVTTVRVREKYVTFVLQSLVKYPKVLESIAKYPKVRSSIVKCIKILRNNFERFRDPSILYNL